MVVGGSLNLLTNRHRQVLTLSAGGAAVFIIIATIANYSMFRLDRTVVEYTSAIVTLSEMALSLVGVVAGAAGILHSLKES